MNKTVYLAALLSLLNAHLPSDESPIPNPGYGSNTSLFVNFGTASFELDGIFEFQTNNGLFLELWGNSQRNSKISLNTSLGIINPIYPKLIVVGGYSNHAYSNLMSHEVFFGGSTNLSTTITFITLGSKISFNHLGIIDVNSLIPKLPFDLTLSGILSTELEERGNDLFINFSKNFQSGLYLGYTFSRERYEDAQTKIFTYIKDERHY
jgi:hypothetical protein